MPFIIGHKVMMWKTTSNSPCHYPSLLPLLLSCLSGFSWTGIRFYLCDFTEQQAVCYLKSPPTFHLASTPAALLFHRLPNQNSYESHSASSPYTNNYSCQISFVLDYKHWQMFHPASHPREVCRCSSVPVESYATFQVEGRYFMKWVLSPGRSTSLLQRICYNLT